MPAKLVKLKQGWFQRVVNSPAPWLALEREASDASPVADEKTTRQVEKLKKDLGSNRAFLESKRTVIAMRHPFKSDGCSGGVSRLWRLRLGGPPPWEGCCLDHDRAYWRGGTARERWRADAALHACVVANGHPGWALTMWLAVRFFGHPYWPFSWRWNFGHDWPTQYPSQQKE